ncbi:zinc finger protein 839 isoform X2 [Bufo bufo]|uniref:zinc finger protein 839 isoform X2 n=1 Tax=Bufo bufo TaxID=8384 RepID=UPI001ABEA530|nr:zinc finger protein 839 isoform X2 [Bufo bufo]
MAALGCPSNMAAVVNALEQMEEYVQVVVGADGDPSQVVMVQRADGGLLRPVQELSPELLRSLSQSDAVFYVQSDGSLVPGGSLEDVQAGVRLVTGGGHELEAAHPEVKLVTRGQMEEAVTGGHVVEAAYPEMRLETGGQIEEAITGGHVVEASYPEMRLETGGQIEEAITGDHVVEAAYPEMRLGNGGQIEEAVAGGHVVEAAYPEMRLETGGQIEEDITGGHVVETAYPEMRLETGGQIEEAITGGHVVEAMQSEMRLDFGGQLAEATHHPVSLATQDIESGAHVMETIQSAVNLVTRGQEVEAAHPEMILIPGGQMEDSGVNLVTGGQVVEAEQSVMEEPMSLVNGGQVVEEVLSPDMAVETGGGLEEAHPDMLTALNLTKDRGRVQERPEVSLASAGAPEMAAQGIAQSQSLPAVVGAARSGLPTLTAPVSMLKDAAQQLKTVAHHVALREGDSVTRILNQKQLKFIHVQVPGAQATKSADPVVLNLSAVHTKTASPGLPSAQNVQIKSLSESGRSLVVNASSLESPVQILVRQTQPSAAKPRNPDPNKNGRESKEHRSCVAHPQNGARASYATEQTQKKGHKRKKSIKIKTRSGRISRPPKHKAKDYKFLKVGDLIQDSTSDSEDYSELSTDEEEKGAKEHVTCDTYTVKNALFQCQTCEKSYMGKGGLSRHYRLYPSHGQMEPLQSGVGGHLVPSEPKKPNPRSRKRLLEDPLNPIVASLPTLDRDGLQFVPVTQTCRGRRQMTGRRFGRHRKILAIASSEQNALTAKEFIQQCEDKDLKEHVAPCFSERLSVYDFLLVKVKQEHPDKPLFPHLYKELEKLHSMVRILAQEYFNNGAAEKGLEVADSTVAASLGISSEKVVKVSASGTSAATEEQRRQLKEGIECVAEETMPPSKRPKLDEPESVSSTQDVTTGNATDINEEQEADLVSIVDQLACGNDTCSGVTNNGTEKVIEVSHPNVTKEEAENLHTITDPASIPCDIEQNVEETSLPLVGSSSPESSDFTQISSQCSEKSLGDAIQSEVIQEGTGAEEVLPGGHSFQLPCPPSSAADPVLFPDASSTTIAEETCSESLQGLDTFISPEIIASDQCPQAFGFHHGHELVFVHGTEETVTGEVAVIYDGAGSPANPQLGTEVALVELK